MNSTEILNSGKLFCAKTNLAKREFAEDLDPLRDEFKKDRDRILYSKEFRRLSGKTQVFVAGFDDNMRTRLTHTLEVAHISKAMSSNLGLNSNLAEAIALGHDVGHTPFGHVGERTLNMFMNGCIRVDNMPTDFSCCAGFKHNLQGLRVLKTLEKITPRYDGLNLTNYTLWGISNHTDLKYKQCGFYSELENKCLNRNEFDTCPLNGLTELSVYDELIASVNEGRTFEAMVVQYADEIAQRHHDIEDGLYAGLLTPSEMIDKIHDFFSSYTIPNRSELELLRSINSSVIAADKSTFLSRLSSFLIGFYRIVYAKHFAYRFKSLHKNFDCKSESFTKDQILKLFKDFDEINDEDFDDFIQRDKEFKKFLSSRVIFSETAQIMDEKADYLIKQLFISYVRNPKLLPDNTIRLIIEDYSGNKVEVDFDCRNKLNALLFQNNEKRDPKFIRLINRKVCDYIAGMTDQYALDQYSKLFGTNNFRKGM